MMLRSLALLIIVTMAAGCSNSSNLANPVSGPAPPDAPTLHTVTFNGGVTATADDPTGQTNVTWSGWGLPQLRNVTSATLVATWGAPPSVSTTKTLTIRLVDEARTTYASGTGSSPLRMDVNTSVVGHSVKPIVDQPTGSVTLNENITVALSITYLDTP